jgi:hypothetical protein
MAGKFLVVAGSGSTSRANVETLLEDYLYSRDHKNYMLVLPFEEKPSQGQVYAYQVAEAMGVATIVMAPSSAKYGNIAKSTLIEAEDLPKTLEENFAGETVDVFLLWSDEDPICQSVLAACKNAQFSAYDLCMGLVPIHVEAAVEAPQRVLVPDIERTTSETSTQAFALDYDLLEPEDEDDEGPVDTLETAEDALEDEEEDSEGDEVVEAVEDLYFALQDFAEYLAESISNRVIEKMKEGKRAPKRSDS